MKVQISNNNVKLWLSAYLLLTLMIGHINQGRSGRAANYLERDCLPNSTQTAYSIIESMAGMA